MNISGTLEERDLLAAYWVAIRPRRSLAVTGIGILVLCIFMLTTLVITHHVDSSFWVVSGALVYFLVVFVVLPPYRLRRHYLQRKDLQRAIRIHLTDDVVSWENETGIINKPWSDYLKWKEGRNIFLMYTSDGTFQVIPKRFVSGQEDIDRLRGMLKNKIVKHET